MKVTYYLPAHPSYFHENYTQDEVERAIEMFRFLFKPGKLGEIPESFVFLTKPGKSVAAVFESSDMERPDEKTTERWLRNTNQFAQNELNRLLEKLNLFLQAPRNKSSLE